MTKYTARINHKAATVIGPMHSDTRNRQGQSCDIITQVGMARHDA